MSKSKLPGSLLEIFTKQLSRLIAYEKNRVNEFFGLGKIVPSSFDNNTKIGSDDTSYKSEDILKRLKDEVDPIVADIYAVTGNTPGTTRDVNALNFQVETICRLQRAESLRSKSFRDRAIQAVGRRMGHSSEAGMRERLFKGTAEKLVLKAKEK